MVMHMLLSRSALRRARDDETPTGPPHTHDARAAHGSRKKTPVPRSAAAAASAANRPTGRAVLAAMAAATDRSVGAAAIPATAHGTERAVLGRCSPQGHRQMGRICAFVLRSSHLCVVRSKQASGSVPRGYFCMRITKLIPMPDLRERSRLLGRRRKPSQPACFCLRSSFAVPTMDFRQRHGLPVRRHGLPALPCAPSQQRPSYSEDLSSPATRAWLHAERRAVPDGGVCGFVPCARTHSLPLSLWMPSRLRQCRQRPRQW